MRVLKKQLKTMDEYIAAFPINVQEILERLRRVIRESAPNCAQSVPNSVFILIGELALQSNMV